MTASNQPRCRYMRPSMQPESPGPLGINDSASPDTRKAPPFTPGPVGINDNSNSSGMSDAEKLILKRLNNGWSELEESRQEIFQIWQLGMLLPDQDTETKMAEAWKRHRTLTLAYFALMTEYLRDYYDPNANYGAYVRIGWMMGGEILQQAIGNETGSDAIEITVNLTALQCQMAFKAYQNNRDKETLFYFVTLAAEVQLHSYEQYRKLPFAVQSMLQRMAEDFVSKPITTKQAWKDFIQSITTGLKPGDPLWLREMVKVVDKMENPKDPIKAHYQRSKMHGDI